MIDMYLSTLSLLLQYLFLRFAASGSHDTTVKVLDVNKMYHFGNQAPSDRRDQGADVRPVLRTLYDHTGPVNSVQFHPSLAYLFTGSADKTVKVFDLTRPSQQLKALSSIPDSSIVQCMTVLFSSTCCALLLPPARCFVVLTSLVLVQKISLKRFSLQLSFYFSQIHRLMHQLLNKGLLLASMQDELRLTTGPSLRRLFVCGNATPDDTVIRPDKTRVLRRTRPQGCI